MHARAVPHATAVQVFEDSFHQLRHKDMRGKLVVHFQNEEGIDAGGVSREWFQVPPPPPPNSLMTHFIPGILAWSGWDLLPASPHSGTGLGE